MQRKRCDQRLGSVVYTVYHPLLQAYEEGIAHNQISVRAVEECHSVCRAT